MKDTIYREDAINAVCNRICEQDFCGCDINDCPDYRAMVGVPSAGQIMTATSNTVVSDTVQMPVMDGTTERLPSAERTVAHIQDFTQYQIDWLTAHDDLELEPELESWVIRFLKDTADCYEKEYLTSAERKGKWLRYGEDGYPNEEDTVFWQCDQCLEQYTGRTTRIPNYCPNCGARMVGDEE